MCAPFMGRRLESCGALFAPLITGLRRGLRRHRDMAARVCGACGQAVCKSDLPRPELSGAVPQLAAAVGQQDALSLMALVVTLLIRPQARDHATTSEALACLFDKDCLL